MDCPDVVYVPSSVEDTRLARFRKFVEKKYDVTLEDALALQAWSARNYPEFWECVWIYFDVLHSKPYEEVFDRERSFHNMQWFKGARLNSAENVFRYRDSHLALIALDEAENIEYVSYSQMYEEVKLYTAAMIASGVRKGDKVACFMSNRKEAIMAFLATCCIGAVWSGALPLLGAKAVVSRFELIRPKLLFTVENFPHEGTEMNMLPKMKDIVSGLPSLEKIIIVPSRVNTSTDEIKTVPKGCTLNEFLELGRNQDGQIPELKFEQLPFDHPLSISYTSGTTGKPKALVHSTGSFLAMLKDFGLHQNCSRDDIYLSVSPVGWISWTMYTNCLHLGVTICIYEGDPFLKSPTYIWDLVDRLGITSMFAGASVLEYLEERGHVPKQKHSLKTLRQIYGSGSPVRPGSFEFMKGIKEGVFCGSLYGSTELLGMCSGVDSNMPVFKGECQFFSLGIDAKCINENGMHVIGERGNLVIANPIPSMPIYLENDESKEKLHQSYLNSYPGYWDQKDEIWINPETNGFVVFGRNDETMNPKGARFSSSEIYFALKIFEEVADSVCTSYFTANMDEKIVLFVKMKKENICDSQFKKRILKTIEEDLSIEHVPDIILQTPDIPYNINGKKMDLLVKHLINKNPKANTECVKNPTSVEFYRNIPELDKL